MTRAVETIASRRHSLVDTFREAARRRDPADPRVLVDGAHLVGEAWRARSAFDVVAVASRLMERPGHEAASLAQDIARAGVRVVRVSDPVMSALSPVRSPSGLVALVDRPADTLDRVLTAPASPLPDGDAPATPLVVCAAGIQDPGNLGALVRAVHAGGATGVVAWGGADPFGWKALRGAMGSAFHVPIARSGDRHTVLDAIGRHGLALVATAARDGRPYSDCDLSGPLVLLLGGEGSGLDREALSLADEVVSIPMRRPVESLNVAVAAALIVYEARRQRRKDTPR